MIQANNNIFALHTKNTTYLFTADKSGRLYHLYYGAAIPVDEQVVNALMQQMSTQNGCCIVADKNFPTLCLDDVCLEVSGRGQGDMREPFVDLEFADGSRTTDFKFESFRISEEKISPDNLPGAVSDEKQSLIISLRDIIHNIRLELVYTAFEDCDCITKFARITNGSDKEVIVHRLMSSQLDMNGECLKISAFKGDWTNEMQKFDTVLKGGKYVNDTVTGFSSSRANPFVMFGEERTDETCGTCFASNLIYSGNHRESFETGGHGKIRVVTGIQPDTFSWILKPDERFDSPEAVITFSENGYRNISINMHKFVREHIVRGTWKKKARPILVNSWEAMYFNINEQKLLKLAETAKSVGAELFVLDDGWFGKRDDDRCSLGDWKEYKEKLPNGLEGLSENIHKLGLMFGIWVEPEMVNEDSDLYRAHPDWTVKVPGQPHATGRNQMLLDLTREEVRRYVIESMSDVFTRGNVDYVKWDMNRNMSDYFCQNEDMLNNPKKQKEFAHRYILGLYEVLGELTERFPDILFEACASGGNRFDLGILCYMPQVWASDNTDAFCRAGIQNGYSYGYPQSVMDNHVSACPNHQTLRVTPLETRFAIASTGILGYECNLCNVSEDFLEEVKEEIKLYKLWRDTLQFGQIYRLDTLGSTDIVRWNIVSEDITKASAIRMQSHCRPTYSHNFIRLAGLDDSKKYKFYNREVNYDLERLGDVGSSISPERLVDKTNTKKVKGEKEEYLLSGRVLNKAGIQLAESFTGTGLGDNTAIYQDYDARLYFMESVDD